MSNLTPMPKPKRPRHEIDWAYHAGTVIGLLILIVMVLGLLYVGKLLLVRLFWGA